MNHTALLDAMRLFGEFGMSVINEKEEYQGGGRIGKDTVFCRWFRFQSYATFFRNLHKDYSMVEVAQIVESHGGKIYGVLVEEIGNDFIRIIIRISNKNINSISETFERYGCMIVQKFYKDGKENN